MADEWWPLIDLCVAAALDAVKADVTLPWGPTTTSAEDASLDTTSTADVSAGEVAPTEPPPESAAEPSPSPATSPTDTTSDNSQETEAPPEPPHRVISLSNFEKALKEITPSSSESLGTLSELRKWNDEFGEGKREKRRNMWGKGSFGFVEKGEGQGQIKVAASAGSGDGPSSV